MAASPALCGDPAASIEQREWRAAQQYVESLETLVAPVHRQARRACKCSASSDVCSAPGGADAAAAGVLASASGPLGAGAAGRAFPLSSSPEMIAPTERISVPSVAKSVIGSFLGKEGIWGARARWMMRASAGVAF